MFSIVDRYKLWNCAAFGCDDDNGGGGGGSSSSSDKDDKPSGVGAGNKLPDGSTSLGSVSATGQYAGDGFEWKQNPNTNALTRVYTGANANAGLGTDVKTGGTSDKNTKEAIANISLNEGTEFAGSAASATDGSLLDLFRNEEDKVGSDSYADQVGVTDYNPVVSYDSTQTGAVNEAAREQPEPPAPAPTPVLSPEEQVMSQEVVSQPTGLPTEVAPDFFDQFAPTIDYTVSQGEAGRGGPDSAAPTFTYQPGVDPELEMLVSLKNSGVDLEPNEYLKATAYERDKIAAAGGEDAVMNASVLPTTQVADAGILSNLANYATDLGSDIKDALLFRDPIGEKVVDGFSNVAVGVPRNIQEGIQGASNYFYNTAPLSNFSGSGITNPAFMIADEINKYLMPKEQQVDRILSQDVNRDPSAGVQGANLLASGFGYVADTLEDVLQPGQSGVFTGDTFSDLNFVGADTGQQLRGGDAVSGAINLGASEGLADTGIDILMSLNPYTRGLSAVINAGEQLTGLEAGISDQIDNAYVAGQLDNNPMFQKALEAQDGNVDNALAVLKNLSYSADVGGVPANLATMASGAVDAVIPGPGKGFTGLAKEGAKRAGVEGGQGAFESYTAISAVNSALGTNFDPTANIAGAATTEALAGSTAAVASPFVGTNQTASQRRFVQDSMAANQAAMEQAAGTQGVASFAVAPANQTAVSTQPEAMTTAPTVFNPNVFPTAGELAQSNVPTAYDIEQDRVAGLLEAPQLDPMATSLDVMAAQEIIENQIRETGTISPEVMTNLQAATGLSMNDLSSMAVNASTGTLGGQTFPINVGSETPSDLMDQPTGIGGGGNIGVETLPNGDTLLRNNETGRTTVVDKGENLANAIQVFDEVTTPFGAPEIDTTAPSLPAFNVAGAPGQPVLPAGTDTAPVAPSAPQDPTIPEVDIAGLGSLTPGSRPDIDTSSLPEGIAAAAQDNNPNQESDLEAGVRAALDAADPPNTATLSDAIDLVNTTGKATPSHLQRNLGITYSQASDLVNQMQNQGLVSEANYVGNRTVNTDAVTMAAAAQDNNPNQPAQTGTTFTTARGSTYTVTGDGTTVRNRAPDEEGGDFVQQPQSGKTIFVSNEDKQKFGSLFQQGEPGLYQFTPVAGTTDKAQLVFTKDYGPNKAGDPVPGTEITYSNTPESGQSPIEIYNSTNDNPNNIHFGSEITQVGDGDTIVEVPATTDGDTLPAATGTEVIIDDDGSAKQVGGLEGEILGPEISTEVTPDQDTGVTIDVDAVSITPGQSNIPNVTAATDTDSNIPNVTAATDTDTAVDQNIKPLIEVDVDEPPEEPIVVDDDEETVVVEVDDDDLVSQITTTDKDGNTITECPEGYREVQTPDGIMCEKIETATTTTGRRTYGVGRTTTTGLAGNIGRQIPRSRTRTRTTTSRSRVKPTTRSA